MFVYDTECLKDEADDPIAAVLYFHPSWVSDTQKVALCGQLMGTSYFLKDCFFKPRILSLQNGKFVLKEFGRFTLVSRVEEQKSRRFSVLFTNRGFFTGCGHRSKHCGSVAATSCESAKLLAEVLSSRSSVAARSVCTARPGTQSESLRETISHI